MREARAGRVARVDLTSRVVRRHLTVYEKHAYRPKGRSCFREVRNLDHIQVGEEFEITRLAKGIPASAPARDQRGARRLALACPEKDFFVPITSRVDGRPVTFLVDANVLSEPTRASPDRAGG